MHGSARQSGFVLVIVLVVLTIAATIVAASARRSCRRALQSRQSAEDLQLRWGTLSCRATCVPAAELLLQQRQAAETEKVTRADYRVTLGGIGFVLVVGDEQCKANVNLLAARRGEVDLASTVSGLEVGSRRVLPIRLRSGVPDPSIVSALPLLYTSYDQLYAYRRPSDLVDAESAEPVAGARVTCWGSGKLNFKRAGRDALRVVLAGVFNETQIDKLLRLLDESPDCTIGEAVKHLKLGRKKAWELRRVLTDVSYCHSLWVVAKGRRRSWHRLFVAQIGDAENDSMNWRFDW
jgi:hypothetical protein